MAPKASDPADMMISLSYKDYLDEQNEVVQAVNNHNSILQAFLGSFTMSMATMRATLLKTRESLKTVTSSNNAEILQHYPNLLELLGKEPQEITNSLNLPSLGGLPVSVAGAPEKKTRKKREQKPKDPNAPKRPNTAFFLFLENTRPLIRKALGDSAKPGDVAAEQRVRWKALPEDEKEIYRAQYQANFKEYQGEVADYKAKGGHIEEDELHPVEDDVEAVIEDAAESSDESDDVSSDEEEEVVAPPPPPPAAKKGKRSAAAAAKDDISSKIDPRLTAINVPKPATTPAKSPEKEKKPRGKAAAAAATAAAAAEAAAAAAAQAQSSAEKPKVGRKKKGAAGAAPASTPVPAPAATPAVVAAPEVDGTASTKKKRQSTGPDLEERKKKRRETMGDDY